MAAKLAALVQLVWKIWRFSMYLFHYTSMLFGWENSQDDCYCYILSTLHPIEHQNGM